MSRSERNQLCICITPIAYKELTQMVGKVKQLNKRWTNTAVINSLIRENYSRFLKMNTKEATRLLEEYENIRNGEGI